MRKIICILLLCGLCGCASVEEPIIKEEPKPATNMIPSAKINNKEIRIPSGYVVTHSPIALSLSGSEQEVLSFTKDGTKECCAIRYALSTVDITDIEQANKVLQEFNAASIYNAYPSNTVANEIKLINDENTYLLQAIAMDSEGNSYYINSFVTKDTKDIYSVCVLYNPDMTSDCDGDLLSSIYSDIGNIIYGTEGEENRFSNYTVSMLDTWCATEKKEGALTLEHISEVTERELTSNVDYTLEEDNALFTFEAIEGAGKIILDDKRFGTRELLMGYDSLNAPTLYENIALVRNTNVHVEGDIKVIFMRKKWKED